MAGFENESSGFQSDHSAICTPPTGNQIFIFYFSSIVNNRRRVLDGGSTRWQRLLRHQQNLCSNRLII